MTNEKLHKDALRTLFDGLCAIRQKAHTDPESVRLIADAMHNIPNGLLGEDRAGDEYLEKQVKLTKELILLVVAK